MSREIKIILNYVLFDLYNLNSFKILTNSSYLLLDTETNKEYGCVKNILTTVDKPKKNLKNIYIFIYTGAYSLEHWEFVGRAVLNLQRCKKYRTNFPTPVQQPVCSLVALCP